MNRRSWHQRVALSSAGLALILSLTPLEATDFVFERNYLDLDYGGNGRPGWVQAGDMDQDGDADIVAGGGFALYVYRNDGKGEAWTRFGNLDGTRQIGCNAGILYDVDGDGDLDAVAAKYNSELGWWENPGTLSGQTWSFHRLDAGDPGWFLHDFILSDLDRDGKAEEFVAVLLKDHWDAPYHIFWYRIPEDPRRNWFKHVVTRHHAGPQNNHSGLDVADLDGDGDVDIGFADGWFESSGRASRSWARHDVTDIYGISNNKMRDIDGDGDVDLVMAAGHHGQGVYWFEQRDDPRSAGSWVRHDISPVAGKLSERKVFDSHAAYLHHPEGLQVEDLDGDGDLDVLVPELFFGKDPGEPAWHEQAHNLYIYENLGGRPPEWRAHNIAPDSYPSHLPYLVDINGDGRLDIISEATGHGIVSYYENKTAPAKEPR